MKKLFLAAILVAVANLSYAQNMGTSPVPSSATDNTWLKYIETNTRTTASATSGVAQASTTSGQSGILSQGAATTAAPTYLTGKTYPLSLDTSGALRVTFASGGGDASAANQTAVQANAGADASKAVSIQGITSGKAVPVSSTTLSTAAKQPALGTAGTASSDVITVQGVASMTKLLVTPDSVALPANQSVNVAQINGVTTLMGAGATGTGSIRNTPVTPATIATGQITASGSPATLVAANTTRAILTVRNQDTSLSVYVGPATVSSSNGALIKAGESRTFRGATLLQVIAPSGSPVVDYVDESY